MSFGTDCTKRYRAIILFSVKFYKIAAFSKNCLACDTSKQNVTTKKTSVSKGNNNFWVTENSLKFGWSRTDLFDPFFADFTLFLKLQTQKKIWFSLWEQIFICSLLQKFQVKTVGISVGYVWELGYLYKVH